MSSQWANSLAMTSADSGSLAVKFSTVWSEKTTPQPNVTPGGLRSNISISCDGSRSFIEIAKLRPAGPPPMQAIFTRSAAEVAKVGTDMRVQARAREAGAAASFRTPRCNVAT